MSYTLTYDQLFHDLHLAYYDARRHKRRKAYQLEFEMRLEQNLKCLCDELWTRTYQPRPSTCFIINDPKKREVFAAQFRDRIVHHLYYNYTHELFERTFIHDSYSCIRKRGTHFGIHRLDQHIRQESRNYTRPCYVLKMDIKGYFMNIDRSILLNICLQTLRRMMPRHIHKNKPEKWQDTLDAPFLYYLTETIVTLDPTVACTIKGSRKAWDGLPTNKSLFHSRPGCGLPIGNLTSQLFSNVYMNELDNYMKRTLGCRHYGRYVDDFYVVSTSRPFLRHVATMAETFLANHLSLEIHKGKQTIVDVRRGVEFLGAYIKPFRLYVSNTTMRRVVRRLQRASTLSLHQFESYRGLVSHYKGVQVKVALIRRMMQVVASA